ncbi:HAD family hydrolase [Algoriphagus limi]|uniref:Haloacid dehalogenase-like hydrolase n=1 Tax=Algoriphagus limi TaxID=2975273 RepID=A0ABT2G2X0_9BACT|nr:HAD family hydrolase [Algoriphagus limi]MCS5489524.1 haloacid dehalogenase-like hydrolase [Algoriphagus limi]
MNTRIIRKNWIFTLFIFGLACQAPEAQKEVKSDEPKLPSWNEGENKNAILDFVEKTTTVGSSDFVPEKDRIAVFDNDGCLWSEQPFYFQLAYAIDYVKKEAPNHPEWNDSPVLKSAIDGDINGILSKGEHGIIEVVMASHTGMTAEEFSQNVKDWLATAKHPETGMAYNQMIYQPMVELLSYLRANGFKTFIVSGGGIDFLRVWAEEAYGIPPYQVIGSSIKAQYEEVDGKKAIVKTPELNFIDDKEGKPVGIHQHIGMRPIIAAGNSDGDYQMLEYTTQGSGPRLGILIHHTDSEREFAYDSLSPIGNLKKGLIDGPSLGWVIVDMAKDWSQVYPK